MLSSPETRPEVGTLKPGDFQFRTDYIVHGGGLSKYICALIYPPGGESCPLLLEIPDPRQHLKYRHRAIFKSEYKNSFMSSDQNRVVNRYSDRARSEDITEAEKEEIGT